MKTISITFFILITAFAIGQNCADSTNIYTFTYGSHEYEVVKEMKDWSTAAACAVERGGYLVHINNQAENDTIYSAIINGAGISTSYTTVMDGGGIAYVWIGGTDNQNEGSWVWDGDNDGSGTQFWIGEGAAGSGGGMAIGGLYNFWGGTNAGTVNEPDDFNNNQDAAAIALNGWPGGSGSLGIASEWNDIAITNSLYFIIEKESSSIGQKSETSFMLFPNPCSENFTIKSRGLSRLEMISISGKLIKDISFTNTIILSTSNYRSGIYILRVINPQGSSVQKLIIE